MTLIPKEGEGRLLLNMVQRDDLTLRLWTNDIEPTRETTAADLTMAHGVDKAELKGSLWKVRTVNDKTEVAYPFVRFLFANPIGRIYGYAILQGRTALLVTRFPNDAPYFARQVGDEIKIRPRIQFR